MFKFHLVGVFFLALSSSFPGCESCDSPSAPSELSTDNDSSGNLVSEAKGVLSEVLGTNDAVPQNVNGVELQTLRGWHANLYPWVYEPLSSSVHPVLRLWTPNQVPSPYQITEQCRQIKEFGGGAAVLEYSPNPSLGDHNYWLSVDFARECGAFYLLYEHIYGTRFIPVDGGPKNMSDPHNRRVFKEDIDFMFKNVIVPYQSRYVTMSGRAVIYLWSSVQMTGDFASLLEEVKKDYPVLFLGSGEGQPNRLEDVARVRALDGFMEYSLGGPSNYLRTVQDYNKTSISLRGYLRKLQFETGKRYVFIPTFQAAYDDTKYPDRTNPPMYARSRDEVIYHAEMIRGGMGSVYDYSVGPFVVQGELFEGAAVIESQCLPATVDTPVRFVGCGTARLKILKEYFGSW